MERVKIVHIADCHLGSSFAYLEPTLAKQRRQEFLCLFRDCVEIVRREEADLFLIAGDLFDSPGCVEAMEYVRTALSTIPHTNVLIVAGNHDPKRKVYDLIDWGSHVHIFKGELEKVSFPKADVYGASLMDTYQPETMMRDIKPNPDKINLLVWHGDIAGGNCNPVTQSHLMAFDYAAMGHIHKTQGIQKIGSSHFAYAGIPEGRGFDETQTGGVIVGEVGKHIVDLRMEKIEKRACRTINIDTMEKEMGQVLKEAKRFLCPNDLVQIVLKNSAGISIEFLKQELEQLCFYLKITEEECDVDYEELKNDTTLKGIFVSHMLERMKGKTEEEKTEAIRVGLRALEGRELFD